MRASPIARIGSGLQPGSHGAPTIRSNPTASGVIVNLDRRVYLATAFAAFVGGSALLLAGPQDPFTSPASLQASDSDVPLVWHESSPPPESVADAASDGAGLVFADGGDGGDGGRGVRVPSIWPVDVRREMTVDKKLTDVGFVR